MSRSAVNPKVLSTNSPQGVPLRLMRAADAKTWKKGEFCELSSGTVQPLAAATATGVYGIFAEDQATSTSTTDAWVRVLQDGEELEMYVYNDSQVSAIAITNKGTAYGAQTASNISYLDLNQTTGQFEVVELGSVVMPERSSYDGSFDGTTGTTAGLCIAKFRKKVS